VRLFNVAFPSEAVSFYKLETPRVGRVALPAHSLAFRACIGTPFAIIRALQNKFTASLRKKRIRKFRTAKADTYFPLDAMPEHYLCCCIIHSVRSPEKRHQGPDFTKPT
jgi:hypothetical protein